MIIFKISSPEKIEKTKKIEISFFYIPPLIQTYHIHCEFMNRDIIMDIYNKFQDILDEVKQLQDNVHNKDLQNILIEDINEIVDIAILSNNIHMSNTTLKFTISLFMTIGELDYDCVEAILDTLTASRIVLREHIENGTSA